MAKKKETEPKVEEEVVEISEPAVEEEVEEVEELSEPEVEVIELPEVPQFETIEEMKAFAEGLSVEVKNKLGHEFRQQMNRIVGF